MHREGQNIWYVISKNWNLNESYWMSCRGEPFHRVVNNKTTKDSVFSAGKKLFYLNLCRKDVFIFHHSFEHSIILNQKSWNDFEHCFHETYHVVYEEPRADGERGGRVVEAWSNAPHVQTRVINWSKSRFFGLPVFYTEKELTKELLVRGRKVPRPIKTYSVWTCGHWWFHSSEKRSHRNQTQLKIEGWRQFVKLLQKHHLPTLPGWRGRIEKIKGELANSPSLAGPEAKMKAEICWASSWTGKLSDMQNQKLSIHLRLEDKASEHLFIFLISSC